MDNFFTFSVPLLYVGSELKFSNIYMESQPKLKLFHGLTLGPLGVQVRYWYGILHIHEKKNLARKSFTVVPLT